jgi:D-tyrosyl-tRNA(Tyr) deacylase
VPREAGAQGPGERPLQARALAAAGQQAVRGARHGPRLKAVVQRVVRARVTPGGEIGPGLCVLLGVASGDTAAGAERLAGKVARLRIFQNDDGRFDLSLQDAGGAALVVSQFTLIADTAKGNRPSFSDAAPPDEAEPVYETFCAALRELGVEVATGVFGARMELELVNDGPVTIVLAG